ncbi:hypothetical protein [Lysobacter hankyongensis]|uniref:Response regulator n=1 Tax=Lysobacter hankyongensis TaxID=1176535 RepID=A0ABP9BUQ3_9GAMM
MKPTRIQTVLVVEDDEPKLRSILSFLSDSVNQSFTVMRATSLVGAIKILSTEDVALAIIDMSLPTFELASNRAHGGQPQGYGGKDILRFIESETTSTLSVVITQYEEFPPESDGLGKSLSTLASELREEFGARFQGVIHYTGQLGEWRESLLKVLQKNDMADRR